MDTRPYESRSKEASRTLDSFPFDGEVYPPSEDTFFMSDVLQGMNLQGRVLEVGVGSGYLTEILSRKAEYVVGTDLSYRAIKASKSLLDRRKASNVDLILSDSASVFRRQSFNLIVSNPPYLPCNYEEEPLWCGGREGIEFTLRLARQSRQVLAQDGKVLFIVSSLARYKKLARMLKGIYSKVQILRSRKVSLFEKLFILECSL